MEDQARRFPRLLGERLCLNFADTIDPRIEPNTHEYLHGFDDLAGWAVYAGVLDAERAAELRERAGDDAPAMFVRSIALREAIYRVFVAVAHSRASAAADLDLIHREYTTGF